MLVLLFKNGDDDTTRNFFDEYCMPLVQIKDCNGLIDNKPSFDQHVKKQTRSVRKTYQEMMNIQLEIY